MNFQQIGNGKSTCVVQTTTTRVLEGFNEGRILKLYNHFFQGDELTFNYNFVSKGDKKKICHCSASKCSGYIGQKYRPPVELATATIGGSKGGKAGKNGKSAKRRKSTVKKAAGSVKRRKSNAVPEVQQVDTVKVEPLEDEPENRSNTIAEPTMESDEVATEVNP